VGVAAGVFVGTGVSVEVAVGVGAGVSVKNGVNVGAGGGVGLEADEAGVAVVFPVISEPREPEVELVWESGVAVGGTSTAGSVDSPAIATTRGVASGWAAACGSGWADDLGR